MKPRRKIEREFGVPLAGEILEDPAQWTRTALKRLPSEGPLDLEAIFGRRAPLVVDLGCGNGRYLLGSAVWRRDHDHLGIDILPLVLRYATRRANQRGLSNIRLAACDALTLVEKYLPPQSVREMHCYHPQPFHEPGQAGRRLLTPKFLALAHSVLDAEGAFFVQTDNEPYWHYIRQVLPEFFQFHELDRPWPDAPRGRTRREILALRRRLPIYRGWGTKRGDLGPEAVYALANTLPPPTFEAAKAGERGETRAGSRE